MRIIFSCIVAGILTMGIEMVAGRMLVPVLGSSLYQWAGLIGIALLSYITGYFLHERLFSQARPKIIALVLSIPFICLLLVRAYYPDAAKMTMPLNLMFSSVLLSAFIVFIPSMIWAGFLPFLQSLPEVKRPARLLAYSALGNLIGVWFISFFLIPQVGTLKSLLVLTFLSGLLSLLWMKKTKAIAGFFLLALLSALQFRQASLPHRKFQFQTESAYQSIAVTPQLMLRIDGNNQMIYRPGESLNNGGEKNYYNFATLLAEKIKNQDQPSVLILGLGGGLVATQISNLYPEISVDTVEIDQKMIEVARNHFQLPEKVNTINEDARIFLTRNQKKYDYIFLDTYLNSFVPFHLVTVEFAKLLADTLKPNGFLVVNLLQVMNETGFLKKFSNTIHQSFSHVYRQDLESINSMLIAANDSRFEGGEPVRVVGNQNEIFTDDLSDSDLLLFRSRKNLAVHWSGFDFF